MIYVYYYFGMGTKTLAYPLYTYHFRFYNNSYVKPGSYSGGLTYDKKHVTAIVRPVDLKLPHDCEELNNQEAEFTQAFMVNVYGQTRPVCVFNDRTFELHFTYFNKTQLFEVWYEQAQNPSIYPELKSIFSSIKISQ